MRYLKLFESYYDDGYSKHIVYHATNTTWKDVRMSGLGFHGGTLRAAIDILSQHRYLINPVIKKYEFKFENMVHLNSDYVFHNDLLKVVEKLYKDDIISKKDREEFGRLYVDDINFDSLRNLLLNKYNIDGFQYRNNIEDRGSDSYIALNSSNITLLDQIEFKNDLSDINTSRKRSKVAEKYSTLI